MKRFLPIALAAAALTAGSAHAGVTVYSSLADFTAAGAIEHTATFEGVALGKHFTPVTDDGILISSAGKNDLYVTDANEALEGNPHRFTTRALSADGDEDFDIRLASGLTFGALGIDYITNGYGPTVLSLFTAGGTLIEALTVPILPDHVGFFGVRSTTAIGYVTTIVDHGFVEDSGLDNIRIGPMGAAGVPEPASWALMIAGFGGVGALLRRRAGAQPA